LEHGTQNDLEVVQGIVILDEGKVYFSCDIYSLSIAHSASPVTSHPVLHCYQVRCLWLHESPLLDVCCYSPLELATSTRLVTPLLLRNAEHCYFSMLLQALRNNSTPLGYSKCWKSGSA
jgi:hypothetical protein